MSELFIEMKIYPDKAFWINFLFKRMKMYESLKQ